MWAMVSLAVSYMAGRGCGSYNRVIAAAEGHGDDRRTFPMASAMGCLDAVQDLISTGTDVDQQFNGLRRQGLTPLMSAAAYGDVEIAKALLAAGADSARKDAEGSTALDWAMGPCPDDSSPGHTPREDCKELKSRRQQVQMLLRAASQRAAASQTVTRKDAALFAASKDCDASVIDALIRSGADVNKQHPGMHTPLGAALLNVQGGHCNLKAITRLVEAGANAFALVLLPEMVVPEPLVLHFAKVLGQEHPVIMLLMADGSLMDPDIDPDIAQFQVDTMLAIAAMYPREAREEAHTEAVEKQKELEDEVERLSQLVEGPWVSRGVVLALFVGLATLSIVFQKRAFMVSLMAGARAPEGNRRQGRARNRGRNQDQDRGQGQGRGRGQARRRAVEPRVPTIAPTPSATTTAHAPVEEPDWWLELKEFHDELDAAARRERPDFACPVTQEIMRVPYMLVDGNESLHTYEYNALVSWFITEGNDTDPARNMRIEPARRNFISDGRLGREIRNWCEDKARMWRQELKAQPSPGRAAARADVHVFVDHSNAAIGARMASKQLDLPRLAQCVEAGREVRERVAVGSHESELSRAGWEQLGYTVAADPRRGKERFVDEALHAQLMRTAAKRFDPGRIIALVTGDGNANEGRTSFPQCIEEALKNDWHVELHSWRRSMSQVYTKLAEEYTDHFSIHYLDDCC